MRDIDKEYVGVLTGQARLGGGQFPTQLAVVQSQTDPTTTLESMLLVGVDVRQLHLDRETRQKGPIIAS